MRVTTAFNRLLEIPGAAVGAVSFEREGVVVGLGPQPARPALRRIRTRPGRMHPGSVRLLVCERPTA